MTNSFTGEKRLKGNTTNSCMLENQMTQMKWTNFQKYTNLTQEEENLNKPIATKEIELIIRKLQ